MKRETKVAGYRTLMYGGKVMVEKAKEIGEEARVGTLQIVRESVEAVDVDMGRIEHFEKLSKIKNTGPAGTLGGMDYAQVAKLKALGFGFFVRASLFVPRFRYAAVVRRGTNTGWTTPSVRGDYYSGNEVVYAGDIPDSVLDKAYNVVYGARIDLLTIHSHQPFPVELRPCDPVLVGWARNPEIVCDMRGEYKCMAISGRALGVIIAVWDMEKEEQL